MSKQKDLRDSVFYVPGGDPGFDAERNKRIIGEVEKNNLKVAKKKKQEWKDQLEERADATAHFLRSRKAIMAGKNPNMVDQYFGKRYLAYLRGEEWIERLRDPLVVRDQNGKVIRRPN